MKSVKRFAVFDIDGTLVRWQLYHTLVDKLAKLGALGSSAEQDLHQARMSWKRREQPEGFSEYEKVLIKTYEAALPSLTSLQFDQAASEVINQYQDQVYTYTRDLIKQLKSREYTLLAISGSHHELVEPIAAYYGFDDFAATRYERNASGFSGKVFVASNDKQSILQQMVAKHGLSFADSYAIGDSMSDAPMLALVEHPIAFNPDKNLYKHAHKNGWKIVVERKNVIYQLTKRSDYYLLS